MTVNLSMLAGAGAQFFDNNGVPLAGGLVYTYTAGTTTPQATYTTSSGSTAHTNPIVLDSAGRVPSGGEIWLTDAVSYKFLVKTSVGVTIGTYDNVTGNASGIVSSLAAPSGSSLVGFIQAGTGAVATTVQAKLRESVSVKDFGATGNGSTNDTAAIQLALDSGAKKIYAPSGTYKILSTLTIPTGVSLEGDGPDQTIFDGSTTTYAALTSGRHIQTEEGTFTALPALSVSPSKGATTLTFVSAPSLQINDVFLIYNPTDFSYSGFREVYRAGEYLRVASVSGSVVTLQGTLADSYTTSAVNLYRFDDMTTCKVANFKLIGLNDLSNPVFGLFLNSCVDTDVDTVKVENCSYTSISTLMCFNISLTNCTATENFANSSSVGEYGLAIGNSHIVHVIGGYYAAHRHGITTGGFSGIGKVTNRYVIINGAHVTGSNASQVMDFHGNTEYSTVSNCTLDGGVVGGGDYILITSNQIRANTGNGQVAIYMAEMRGLNVTISNNIIENPNASTSNVRGAFIDFGGNNDTITTATYKGGTINIVNNLMTWGITATADCPTIKVVNRGYTASNPIGVLVKGNRLTMLNDAVYGGFVEVAVISATAKQWNVINISENSMGRGGISNIRNSTANNYSANYVYIHNNVSDGTSTQPITVSNVNELMSIKNNVVSNAEVFSIYAVGVSTSIRCKRVHIVGNTLFDNFVSTTSSSTTNADIICWNASYAVVQSNAGGSFNEYLTVASNASFQLGETITGGTSGSTATIAFKRSTNQIMITTTGSGAFTVTETITGGTSGATTTVSAEAFTTSYRNSYNNIDNLWQGQNVGIRTSTDYVNNVTINTAI
jgi:hypothetical protein